MKKRYTKKQICEAIAYWKKCLNTLNESISPEKLAEVQRQLDTGTWNLVLTKNDGTVSERTATGVIPAELQDEFQKAKHIYQSNLWYYRPDKNKFFGVSRSNIKKVQLLPVGKSVFGNGVTDAIIEEWYSKLRSDPHMVSVMRRNGKTITFEATLKDVTQDEYDRMYEERLNKLWFKNPALNEIQYINLQKWDITDITFKKIPYRVIVSDNTRRIPQVFKKFNRLDDAIAEVRKLSGGGQLEGNGIKTEYHGPERNIWIDQTNESPSTFY